MNRRRETRGNQPGLTQWFQFRNRGSPRRRPLADQETMGTTIAAPMEQGPREERSAVLRPHRTIKTRSSTPKSPPHKNRESSLQFEPDTRPPSLNCTSETTMTVEKKQRSPKGTHQGRLSSSSHNSLSSPNRKSEEVINGIPNWDSPCSKIFHSESEEFYPANESKKTHRDDLSKKSKDDNQMRTNASAHDEQSFKSGSSGPDIEVFRTKKDSAIHGEDSSSRSGPDIEVFRIPRKDADEDENEPSVEEFSRDLSFESSATSVELQSESFVTYERERAFSSTPQLHDERRSEGNNQATSSKRVSIPETTQAERTRRALTDEEREEEMIRIAMERSLLDCDLMRSMDSSSSTSQDQEEEMMRLATLRSLNEVDLKTSIHSAPITFPSVGATLDLGASMNFSELCEEDLSPRQPTANARPKTTNTESSQLQEDETEQSLGSLAAIEQQEREMIELALHRSTTDTCLYQTDMYRQNAAASFSISSIYCEKSPNRLAGQAAAHRGFGRYTDRSVSPSNDTITDRSTETEREKELIERAIERSLQDSQSSFCRSAGSGYASNVSSNRNVPVSSVCIDFGDQDGDSQCSGLAMPRNLGLANRAENLRSAYNCSFSSFSQCRSLLESTDEESLEEELSMEQFVTQDNRYPYSRATVQEREPREGQHINVSAGDDGKSKPIPRYPAVFERPVSHIVERPPAPTPKEETHRLSHSSHSPPSSYRGSLGNGTGRRRESENERLERMEREMMNLAVRRSMRES